MITSIVLAHFDRCTVFRVTVDPATGSPWIRWAGSPSRVVIESAAYLSVDYDCEEYEKAFRQYLTPGAYRLGDDGLWHRTQS